MPTILELVPDTQRGVLGAGVAGPAVRAGGALSVDGLAHLVAALHVVADNLGHAGPGPRPHQVVTPPATWATEVTAARIPDN